MKPKISLLLKTELIICYTEYKISLDVYVHISFTYFFQQMFYHEIFNIFCNENKSKNQRREKKERKKLVLLCLALI